MCELLPMELLMMYELLKYKKTYNKKPCFTSLMDPQS